ncbi:hypothetical protein ACSBR2_028751 [Camellia fascicularis]
MKFSISPITFFDNAQPFNNVSNFTPKFSLLGRPIQHSWLPGLSPSTLVSLHDARKAFETTPRFDSRLCKIVHSHALQMGFQYHLHVVNELLGVYGKIGEMGYARELFDRMSMELDGLEPNIVTWISMLSSHARCGRHEEMLHLYGVMRGKGIGTTAEALAVVVSFCAGSGALDKGEVIHGYVVKGGFENYLFVKNLFVWYGMHRLGNDALKTFKQMIKAGYKPNGVTFVAFLSACSHAELVSEGRELFDQMIKRV